MDARHDSGASVGAVLAIDYGRRRLGLAVSDPGRMLARPLETLERVNRRFDLARLRRVARGEAATQLVVGLPLRLDGTEGDMADEARQFAARVGKALALPVALVDERLTSWEAAEDRNTRPSDGDRRKRDDGRRIPAASKAHGGADGVDSLAAALILEAYLRGEAQRR